MTTYGFVGDLLIRAGVVDADGLSRAIAVQSERGIALGRALADLGLTDEFSVAATIASALSLEFMSETPAEVSQDVRSLLPAAFCRKYRAVPIGFRGNVLQLAVTDPLNYSILQDVEFRTGKRGRGDRHVARAYAGAPVSGGQPRPGVVRSARQRRADRRGGAGRGDRVRPGGSGRARQGRADAADCAPRQRDPQ